MKVTDHDIEMIAKTLHEQYGIDPELIASGVHIGHEMYKLAENTAAEYADEKCNQNNKSDEDTLRLAFAADFYLFLMNKHIENSRGPLHAMIRELASAEFEKKNQKQH